MGATAAAFALVPALGELGSGRVVGGVRWFPEAPVPCWPWAFPLPVPAPDGGPVVGG